MECEKEEEGEVGQHYIDQLGRVVVAEQERHYGHCNGCLYNAPEDVCNGQFPATTRCSEIIFVEVTDGD